jgi:hypothetical protein
VGLIKLKIESASSLPPSDPRLSPSPLQRGTTKIFYLIQLSYLEDVINQQPETVVNDEMRPEYDFSGGVRGKYYEAYQQVTNVVVLDPDVAAVFRDSAAVNEALRLLTKIAKSTAA